MRLTAGADSGCADKASVAHFETNGCYARFATAVSNIKDGHWDFGADALFRCLLRKQDIGWDFEFRQTENRLKLAIDWCW